MSSAKIQTVTFDATGTLFGLRRPVGESYGDVARRHGLDVEDDQLEEVFYEEFVKMPPLAFPPLSLTELREIERLWWSRLVKQVLLEAMPGGQTEAGRARLEDVFEGIFEDLFTEFTGATGWAAYPEAREVVGELKAAGLAVGVISNFDSRLEDVLLDLDLLPLFDLVIHSSGAGAVKPNPAIFNAALAALHAEAATTLHVGDSYEADWVGAREAGMQALLLGRRGPEKTVEDGGLPYGEGPSPGDVQPIPLADLTGVLSYLGLR
jgi:putative hydrolase of the HAD superfamily